MLSSVLVIDLSVIAAALVGAILMHRRQILGAAASETAIWGAYGVGVLLAHDSVDRMRGGVEELHLQGRGAKF